MKEKKGTLPNLKQVLKTFVQSQVTLDEEDRRRSVKVVQDLVEEQFIECMKKEDPLFNELYQGIYYTGSYYEGLKVIEANEFDLNIRLKLPFKEANVQIIHHGIPQGFVQYKLDRPLTKLLSWKPKWQIFEKLSRIMDDTCMYLSQNRLRSWLQSVVDKTLAHNRSDFPNVKKRSCHGPATTLTIEIVGGGPVLDIDLVPVVQLTTYPGSVRQTPMLRNIPRCRRTCFIVPKPPPECLQQQHANSDKFFRVSIPIAEKMLIEKKGCIKMLIKIFKAIRDIESWEFLCSYYIKTVFFWELERTSDSEYQEQIHLSRNQANPEGQRPLGPRKGRHRPVPGPTWPGVSATAEYWSEKRLDTLFLLMLQRFITVLDNKTLPHIFFQKYNLLAGISPDIQFNAKRRFEAILKCSQKDLSKLEAYLLIDGF